MEQQAGEAKRAIECFEKSVQFNPQLAQSWTALGLLLQRQGDTYLVNTGDKLVLELREAFRKGDTRTLGQKLPQLDGHPLQPLAAYWDMKLRLEWASADDVRAFTERYAGSYYEDRLRNDWLLLLGRRGDWATFATELPRFRMNDDREVQCYGLLVQHQNTGADVAEAVRDRWMAQKEADEGCSRAARELLAAGKLAPLNAWHRARQGMELGRSFVVPDYWGSRSIDYLWQGIGAYLRRHPRVRYLFGAVSMSAALPLHAREQIVAYYAHYYGDPNGEARSRHPFRYTATPPCFDTLEADTAFRVLKTNLDTLGATVPMLYKQYTELCEPGGARFLAFGVDPDFSDSIDGLIEVDLHRIRPKKRERYLGQAWRPTEAAA